jgi:hypothetical protein
MLIWILALLLFAAFGFAGFSLGAIRLVVAFIGLVVASLLAVPLGHLTSPLLGAMGLKNPVLLWVLGPFAVFMVIVIIGNAASQVVHQKADVYYKYKAGDLRMGLWHRLNARLGLAVGLLNAAVYLILISWVIYVFSYWTAQMVTGEGVAFSVRMLNSAGQGLQSSGMAKVAAAIDRMPESYYQAADVVGLIYHNDLLEGRLSHYPAFLAMGERAEFQDIANDKDFTELRQRQPPIAEIMDYPKAQVILKNPDLLREIWGLFSANLTDLEDFLKTGKSAKYDNEPLVGRWDFDAKGTLNYLKRLRPNINFYDMQRAKAVIPLSYSKTTLVATTAPEKLAFLKDFGRLRASTNPKQPLQADFQTFKGQWSGDGGKYQFSFSNNGPALEGTVEGDRLTISGNDYPLVFGKE